MKKNLADAVETVDRLVQDLKKEKKITLTACLTEGMQIKSFEREH